MKMEFVRRCGQCLNLKGCIFEYVYLARPDTSIAGQSVHATRVRIGKKLAIEAPVKADLVIPVPESGTPAAIGYAQESGIPYGLGTCEEFICWSYIYSTITDN